MGDTWPTLLMAIGAAIGGTALAAYLHHLIEQTRKPKD
jgi:hypothetical protein